MRKTLIVGDDNPLASTLARALKKCGCDCVVVHDVATSREASQAQPFELALCDIGLPDGNGLDLVQPLRRSTGRPVAVVITARDDHEATAEAFQRGAVDAERVLLLHGWPGNVRELGDTIEQLLAAGHERITMDAVRTLLREEPPPVEEARTR